MLMRVDNSCKRAKIGFVGEGEGEGEDAMAQSQKVDEMTSCTSRASTSSKR